MFLIYSTTLPLTIVVMSVATLVAFKRKALRFDNCNHLGGAWDVVQAAIIVCIGEVKSNG